MENGNHRFPDIRHGFYAVLRQLLPGLPVPLRAVITLSWLLVMIGLALFGFLEPRAEFHYLAM
jgi:hypothetical protein